MKTMDEFRNEIERMKLREMDELRGVLGIVAGVGETIPLFDFGEIA